MTLAQSLFGHRWLLPRFEHHDSETADDAGLHGSAHGHRQAECDISPYACLYISQYNNHAVHDISNFPRSGFCLQHCRLFRGRPRSGSKHRRTKKYDARERPAPLLSAIHERNSSREASVESILDINKDAFCEAIQKSPALALMPKEVNANAHKGVWRTLFTYGTRVPKSVFLLLSCSIRPVLFQIGASFHVPKRIMPSRECKK